MFFAIFNSVASQQLVLKVTELATGSVVKTMFINATKGNNKTTVQLNNHTTSGNYIVTLDGDNVKYLPAKLILNK